MPHEFSFAERLAWSEGTLQRTTPDTIKAMLGPGCTAVTYATDLLDQRAGTDYTAILRRGAEVGIDHKARELGCARYWRCGPEMALEKWSVVPNTNRPTGHVGWTLDESKQTDYILFTFDPVDSQRAYLVPFQILRIAFRRNVQIWYARYRCARQRTTDRSRWESECVFIPWVALRPALTKAMEAAA